MAAWAADPVIAALGELGTPVDCSGLRSLDLQGPLVLWLVVDGAMDLFAVDAAFRGQRHFLGRVHAGTLLLGPVQGPDHTLVARPLPGCWLRRIELRELREPREPYDAYEPHHPYAPQWEGWDTGQWYADPWRRDGYGDGGGGAWPSPLEDAFARGIGRGLRVLYQAPLDGAAHATGVGDGRGPGPGQGPEPGAGTDAGTGMGMDAGTGTDEDILWIHVPPGAVRYGAAYDASAASTLLVDPAVWQGMVDQQHRLLTALGRWIARTERAHADRTEAGIRAGEAARTRADQALLAAIDRSAAGHPGPGGDATLAACRLVADEARITLTDPVGGPDGPAPGGDGPAGGDGHLDAVERVALASRVRTRTVRLAGRWWRENTGPLVGRRVRDASPVALLWRRGRYVAVDPATGTREPVRAANQAHFERRAVMLYRPLPDQPLGLLGLLRFGLHGTRSELRALLLAGLVAVALGALVPVATGQVLGAFVPRAETDLIVQAGVAIVATGVVAAVCMLTQNVAILRVEGRVEATLQPAVWDRLLRLPTTFFQGRSTGELAGAALGVSAIRRALSGVGPVCLQAGTVGAVTLVLLLVHSVPLALVALALLLVIGAAFLGLGLWQLRYQRQLIELSHRLTNQAFQTLRGLPKLRVAAAESFAYAAWAGEFARSRELTWRVGRLRNAVTVLNAVCLPLTTLVMFALLAGPARGTLSASAFLTFSTAVTMMLASVTQATGALLSAAAVLPMFEQLRPILRATPEVTGGSAQPGALSGHVEVRDLSYRYGDGPLVLDGVSFSVRPGEFLAVVGPSGCGKSTLLRLLVGFDRPTAGSVLYDGQDLAALDLAAVRRQCGVVLQHAQPLTGSILDCIRGDGAHTLEEAWEAAAMAGLAEDIHAMPMGMHTMLSDGGGTVSGGQRQRLMIAQALIRRPRLLLLDEATSALDNEAQRVVIESTRALRATRVVIAHRLSTVMDADRVIALSHGRIVQQGTPAELLAEEAGLFHELARRQLR
ncbi:NHLP bacteriocin export ABC transporter permease/ATPase subunit [Streptomyces sp. 4N509B]|uniref:NHLP bacteriocin export ABC transporter permease/ATPase subunit n=1 Tax=Streptomyces sp. 4N509B TaxID=3457413 RepID=UPI003FD44416